MKPLTFAQHLLILTNDCSFSFPACSECIQKFGADLGEEVWEAVNAIFDVLPLAAIVDSKVKYSSTSLCDNNV